MHINEPKPQERDFGEITVKGIRSAETDNGRALKVNKNSASITEKAGPIASLPRRQNGEGATAIETSKLVTLKDERTQGRDDPLNSPGE